MKDVTRASDPIVWRGIERIVLVLASCYMAWLGYELLRLAVTSAYTFRLVDLEVSGKMPGMVILTLSVLSLGWAWKTGRAHSRTTTIREDRPRPGAEQVGGRPGPPGPGRSPDLDIPDPGGRDMVAGPPGEEAPEQARSVSITERTLDLAEIRERLDRLGGEIGILRRDHAELHGMVTNVLLDLLASRVEPTVGAAPREDDDRQPLTSKPPVGQT